MGSPRAVLLLVLYIVWGALSSKEFIARGSDSTTGKISQFDIQQDNNNNYYYSTPNNIIKTNKQRTTATLRSTALLEDFESGILDAARWKIAKTQWYEDSICLFVWYCW